MLHLKNSTKNLITPWPFSIWWQVKRFFAQEYNSPTTFPCLLYHKSAALMSHKLYDTREFAPRDKTLCAVKCELRHFSKGVPAATSQKYYPAENFPRSVRFSTNPVAGSQVTLSSFQLKTTNTVCPLQTGKLAKGISGSRGVPSCPRVMAATTEQWLILVLIFWQQGLSPEDHPSFTKWSAKHRICFSPHHKNLGYTCNLLLFNFPPVRTLTTTTVRLPMDEIIKSKPRKPQAWFTLGPVMDWQQ